MPHKSGLCYIIDNPLQNHASLFFILNVFQTLRQTLVTAHLLVLHRYVVMNIVEDADEFDKQQQQFQYKKLAMS